MPPEHKRYRVEFDRTGCIGAGACAAVCPDFWEIKDDGKASLKGASKEEASPANPEGERQVLELDEKDLGKNMEAACACNKEAAASCPVSVIRIFDAKTGKQIA